MMRIRRCVAVAAAIGCLIVASSLRADAASPRVVAQLNACQINCRVVENQCRAYCLKERQRCVSNPIGDIDRCFDAQSHCESECGIARAQCYQTCR